MKVLNGSELAGYIKERQAQQVRALRQAHGVQPRLAIVQTIDDPVIDTYVRLKQKYGADIGVEVDTHKIQQSDAMEKIRELNADTAVHGIIVQLPLAEAATTDELLNAVAPGKDVDGLGSQPSFDPATPMAINWLLAGYNVTLKDRAIVIVGNGRLVGAPLAKMWKQSGLEPVVVDRTTPDIQQLIKKADIVVTAAGSPGVVTSDMLRPDTVVVDAATSSENGVIVGDVADDVRARQDLTITPARGGVGPLTVSALFDNVIRAARLTLSD